MRPTLHIHLLGDFRLVLGETPVTTITVPRIQSLLAYLVLHHGTPQDRAHLAFLFWPDSTEAQAHTNLRQLVHHLRRSLPGADQLLFASKRHLQWLPSSPAAPWTLDLLELEQALAQAEQAEQAQERSKLRQALERVLRLYRGDLLPSCYEEWILSERDRWRQLFLGAAERLVALLEEDGDYGAAISAAQQLLRQDPLHEATYRHLMRLHALRGERAEALRVYHLCAKRLERELGTEPSALTHSIYAALMQADRPPQTPPTRLPKQKTEAPLQGRKAEWRRLQKAWEAATGGTAGLQPGRLQLVLLTGEAGIGKTRLAQELEGWVSRLGMTTASARCYAALGHLAYAPVTAWLRSDAFQASLSTLDPTTLTEVARLVPEVLVTHPRLPPPAAMTEGWQRQFFFAALARAILSARQPLLLLLDDLHWCDQETLDWLHYFFHFAPEARVLLVGTVRVEETSPEHPLMAKLSALHRDGLITEIPLGPLTRAETTSLAEHLLGCQLDPARSERLYQETEGNPFFAVEMVRAGIVSEGDSVRPDTPGPRPLLSHAASPLPPAVQAVLETRLARLSARARDVASVAAVIGREFAFSVLAHASGATEEEVVYGLDELWQRRIVREHDAGTTHAYDFSHDKLREQIVAALSPAHRRLLHRRIAEALKTVYAEDQNTVCGQIAAHYEQAGFPEQAIPWYQRAGEVASRLYAHTEAQHAFERAAALLETWLPGKGSQGVSWETAAQVYLSLGDASAARGCYEEARQAYGRAGAYIPTEASLWQARLRWKIATTWVPASTPQDDAFRVNGRQAFEEAEQLLSQAADPLNPDWRDEWLALQFARVWWGSVSDMAAAIEKAQPIVEQYGTQEQRKLLAEAVGIYHAHRDRFVIPPERLAAWRAALAALAPGENEAQRGIDLALLGIGLVCAEQFDEAEEQLRQALRLGERTGNAWVQNNCLTFLSLVFRRRSQAEEMRHILAQARSLGVAPYNRILTGHAAWVAWRDGDLPLAERCGRESLQQERSEQMRLHPFLWVGRWPLIGVALAKAQTAAAIEETRLLLDPTQQPPAAPLEALLEAAIHAWDAGAAAQADALLQQAIPLAEQMGYL